jgi:hypothetical protein
MSTGALDDGASWADADGAVERINVTMRLKSQTSAVGRFISQYPYATGRRH